MIKSELIDALAKKRPHLERKEVELAVACMLEQMSKGELRHSRAPFKIV